MPQELSITFSTGQSKDADIGASFSTLAVNYERPVYRFGELEAEAAQQNSPSAEIISASAQQISLTAEQVSPLGTSTATVPSGTDLNVPRAAIMLPRIRAVPGGAPTLKTRQLWEGTVTKIIPDGGFVAVLTDKSNPSNPSEQVVFDGSEISPEDQKLVDPGSPFYWIIGNETTVGGQVKNVSIVQFRRLPAWTKQKLDKAADNARRLSKLLQEEK